MPKLKALEVSALSCVLPMLRVSSCTPVSPEPLPLTPVETQRALAALPAGVLGRRRHGTLARGRVGGDVAAGRLEVDVGRVARRSHGVCDLRARLAAEFLAQRQRNGAVGAEPDDVAAGVGAHREQLVKGARGPG